jgi:hypothetical protein
MSRFEEIDRAGVDRHKLYNILWITASTGTHYIDFQGYPIEQNAIYYMALRQVYIWDARSEIFGHSLIFTEDCLGVRSRSIGSAESHHYYLNTKNG